MKLLLLYCWVPKITAKRINYCTNCMLTVKTACIKISYNLLFENPFKISKYIFYEFIQYIYIFFTINSIYLFFDVYHLYNQSFCYNYAQIPGHFLNLGNVWENSNLLSDLYLKYVLKWLSIWKDQILNCFCASLILFQLPLLLIYV